MVVVVMVMGLWLWVGCTYCDPPEYLVLLLCGYLDKAWGCVWWWW